MKLILASRNVHKLREICAMLDIPGLQMAGMETLAGLPDIVEDGATFAANAVKKAVTVALCARSWAMADDSGLEVDALDGAPGVLSARYAGAHGDDAANNRKLLQALAQADARTARFRCVVALASPHGRAQIVEGVCEGHIIEAGRGSHGFGYDPLFVPDGHAVTFAEMNDSLKNRISHRARAMAAARRQWEDILAGRRAEWTRRIHDPE